MPQNVTVQGPHGSVSLSYDVDANAVLAQYVANAIASGSATTPTTMPANTFLPIWARVHKPSAFARSRAIMIVELAA